METSTPNKSEIMEFLNKNEELLNNQKQCEEEIQKLKNENEKKKEEIKNKNSQELFDLIISELKDYIQSQNKTNEIAEEKQKLQHDINNAIYKSQQASSNYDELEKYNSEILKKIKEINEEKNKIEERLKQNYEETKTQCEKFKEEYQTKYEAISNEAIIKENDELKVKIKECQENANKIKQNISEQMEMRKKQSEEMTKMLNGQINDKLSEINKETNKFDEENAKLKIDIQIEKAKFGDNPNLEKDYNKKFEKTRKEYEKVMKDLIQLSQENRKLKEVDPVSIRKDIEFNKQRLDELVKNNKELQAKIKELKNAKNNQINDAASKNDKKVEDKKEDVKKEEDKKEEDKKEEDKKEEDKKEDEKKEKPEKEDEKKEEVKKEDDKKEETKKEDEKKEVDQNVNDKKEEEKNKEGKKEES